MDLSSNSHTEFPLEMDNIKQFLETSTIHGLTYISTTKKFVQLFWILVVIIGFAISGIMIYQSFQAWNESPVKTTVETLSTTKMNFPKVTVCPPKNTSTNLNYDLMVMENKTISNDSRNELTNYAFDLLQDHIHAMVKANLSRLNESNRYRNWYQRSSKMFGPYLCSKDLRPVYELKSYATSGIISTENFGKKFDSDKVETNIRYIVSIATRVNFQKTDNISLTLEIERISLEEYGEEKIEILNTVIPPESHNITLLYTPNRTDPKVIRFERKLHADDIWKINLKMKIMPGFKIKWYYTGKLDDKIKSDQNMRDDVSNSFTRLDFHKYVSSMPQLPQNKPFIDVAKILLSQLDKILKSN